MAAPDFVMVRLPRELSLLVDAARGDVPRERWVRRTLEEALKPRHHTDPGGTLSAPSAEPFVAKRADTVPYRKPFNPRPKGKS